MTTIEPPGGSGRGSTRRGLDVNQARSLRNAAEGGDGGGWIAARSASGSSAAHALPRSRKGRKTSIFTLGKCRVGRFPFGYSLRCEPLRCHQAPELRLRVAGKHAFDLAIAQLLHHQFAQHIAEIGSQVFRAGRAVGRAARALIQASRRRFCRLGYRRRAPASRWHGRDRCLGCRFPWRCGRTRSW